MHLVDCSVGLSKSCDVLSKEAESTINFNCLLKSWSCKVWNIGRMWSSCRRLDRGTTAESGDCVLDHITPAVAWQALCIWPSFSQLWYFAFLNLPVLSKWLPPQLARKWLLLVPEVWQGGVFHPWDLDHCLKYLPFLVASTVVLSLAELASARLSNSLFAALNTKASWNNYSNGFLWSSVNSCCNRHSFSSHITNVSH